jgi:hypothetical protein
MNVHSANDRQRTSPPQTEQISMGFGAGRSPQKRCVPLQGEMRNPTAVADCLAGAHYASTILDLFEKPAFSPLDIGTALSRLGDLISGMKNAQEFINWNRERLVALVEYAKKNAAQFTPSVAAAVCSGYSKLGFSDTSLFEVIACRIISDQGFRRAMRTQNVAMILSAFGRLKYANGPVFTKMAQRIVKMQNFARSLVHCLYPF